MRKVLRRLCTSSLFAGLCLNCAPAHAASLAFTFNISEPVIVVFNTTLTTANRQTLECNQGTYYGISVQ